MMIICRKLCVFPGCRNYFVYAQCDKYRFRCVVVMSVRVRDQPASATQQTPAKTEPAKNSSRAIISKLKRVINAFPFLVYDKVEDYEYIFLV